MKVDVPLAKGLLGDGLGGAQVVRAVLRAHRHVGVARAVALEEEAGGLHDVGLHARIAVAQRVVLAVRGVEERGLAVVDAQLLIVALIPGREREPVPVDVDADGVLELRARGGHEDVLTVVVAHVADAVPVPVALVGVQHAGAVVHVVDDAVGVVVAALVDRHVAVVIEVVAAGLGRHRATEAAGVQHAVVHGAVAVVVEAVAGLHARLAGRGVAHGAVTDHVAHHDARRHALAHARAAGVAQVEEVLVRVAVAVVVEAVTGLHAAVGQGAVVVVAGVAEIVAVAVLLPGIDVRRAVVVVVEDAVVVRVRIAVGVVAVGQVVAVVVDLVGAVANLRIQIAPVRVVIVAVGVVRIAVRVAVGRIVHVAGARGVLQTVAIAVVERIAGVAQGVAVVVLLAFVTAVGHEGAVVVHVRDAVVVVVEIAGIAAVVRAVVVLVVRRHQLGTEVFPVAEVVVVVVLVAGVPEPVQVREVALHRADAAEAEDAHRRTTVVVARLGPRLAVDQHRVGVQRIEAVRADLALDLLVVAVQREDVRRVRHVRTVVELVRRAVRVQILLGGPQVRGRVGGALGAVIVVDGRLAASGERHAQEQDAPLLVGLHSQSPVFIKPHTEPLLSPQSALWGNPTSSHPKAGGKFGTQKC